MAALALPALALPALHPCGSAVRCARRLTNALVLLRMFPSLVPPKFRGFLPDEVVPGKAGWLAGWLAGPYWAGWALLIWLGRAAAAEPPKGGEGGNAALPPAPTATR